MPLCMSAGKPSIENSMEEQLIVYAFFENLLKNTHILVVFINKNIHNEYFILDSRWAIDKQGFISRGRYRSF